MAAYGAAQRRVPEGQLTAAVYGAIKEQKYGEAIAVLEPELASFPDSRAALSLLGHCYYHAGHFEQAGAMYERLVRLLPDNEAYKLHYAQCLYKAGSYLDCQKAAARVAGAEKEVCLLQLAAAYEQDDLAACRRLLDRCPEADADAMVNRGARRRRQRLARRLRRMRRHREYTQR
jgi:tetratricopeptide repeat protein 30